MKRITSLILSFSLILGLIPTKSHLSNVHLFAENVNIGNMNIEFYQRDFNYDFGVILKSENDKIIIFESTMELKANMEKGDDKIKIFLPQGAKIKVSEIINDGNRYEKEIVKGADNFYTETFKECIKSDFDLRNKNNFSEVTIDKTLNFDEINQSLFHVFNENIKNILGFQSGDNFNKVSKNLKIKQKITHQGISYLVEFISINKDIINDTGKVLKNGRAKVKIKLIKKDKPNKFYTKEIYLNVDTTPSATPQPHTPKDPFEITLLDNMIPLNDIAYDLKYTYQMFNDGTIKGGSEFRPAYRDTNDVYVYLDSDYTKEFKLLKKGSDVLEDYDFVSMDEATGKLTVDKEGFKEYFIRTGKNKLEDVDLKMTIKKSGETKFVSRVKTVIESEFLPRFPEDKVLFSRTGFHSKVKTLILDKYSKLPDISPAKPHRLIFDMGNMDVLIDSNFIPSLTSGKLSFNSEVVDSDTLDIDVYICKRGEDTFKLNNNFSSLTPKATNIELDKKSITFLNFDLKTGNTVILKKNKGSGKDTEEIPFSLPEIRGNAKFYRVNGIYYAKSGDRNFVLNEGEFRWDDLSENKDFFEHGFSLDEVITSDESSRLYEFPKLPFKQGSVYRYFDKFVFMDEVLNKAYIYKDTAYVDFDTAKLVLCKKQANISDGKILSANFNTFGKETGGSLIPSSVPPNIQGKNYILTTFKSGVYKTYYSSQPFWVKENNLGLVNKPDGSNPYVIDIKKYENDEWVDDTSVSITNTSFVDDFSVVKAGIANDIVWTNSNIKDKDTANVFKTGVVITDAFSGTGDFLTFDFSNDFDFDKQVIDAKDKNNYYLIKSTTPFKKEGNILSTGLKQGDFIYQLECNGAYRKVLSGLTKQNAIVSVLKDGDKFLQTDFTFLKEDNRIDNLSPIIEAAYIYKGVLYIQAFDPIPEDFTQFYSSGINSTNGYFYKFKGDITLPFSLEGIVNSVNTILRENVKINAETEIAMNSSIKADKTQSYNLEVRVSDIKGNFSETKEVTLRVGEDNKVLFGQDKISRQILDEIDRENGLTGMDRKAPTIYGVYMYRGSLYLYAVDEPEENKQAVGLDLYAYNYEWYTEGDDGYPSVYNFDILGVDKENKKIKHEKNKLIPHKFNIWSMENNQKIGTSNNLLVNSSILARVRDKNGNIAEINNGKPILISDSRNNTVIWENSNTGGIPEYIKKMLKNERDKYLTEENDKIIPEIKAIYMYKGDLYVLAIDNKALKDIPYGFEFLSEFTPKKDIKGFNEAGRELILKAGKPIKKETVYWSKRNKSHVPIPGLVKIWVVDEAGNKVFKEVSINNSNEVLYGEVGEDIEKLIKDAGGKLNKKDKKEKDSTPPVIERVYVKSGILYVEGYDETKLHNKAYGFNPLEDMIIESDWIGVDNKNKGIFIQKGKIIPARAEIYKNDNSQEIMLPVLIEVLLRDSAGNETREKFFIRNNNRIYKGPKKGELLDGGDEDVKVPNINEGTSQSNKKTIIINPSDKMKNLKNIDWSKKDLVITIKDKETGRPIYKIKKDKMDSAILPQIGDGKKYEIVSEIIDEFTGKADLRESIDFTSKDITKPIIKNISYKDGKVIVTAIDNLELHEKAYAFMVGGVDNNKNNENSDNISDDKFIKKNWKKAFVGETVIVKVRDKAGNFTNASFVVKDDANFNTINPENPMLVLKDETKSINEWKEKISKKFGVDVIDIVEGENVVKNDDAIKINGENKGFIRVKHQDGTVSDILIEIINEGISGRTLVVETLSETNLILAFKQKLMEEFGTINGLTWNIQTNVLSKDESMAVALMQGVAPITVTYQGNSIKLYVVVRDDLKENAKEVSLRESYLNYTIELGKTINLMRMFLGNEFKNENDPDKSTKIAFEYFIVENSNKNSNVERFENELKFGKLGRKSINVLNALTDTITTIKFEVVELFKNGARFKDDTGNVRVYVDDLIERGVLLPNEDDLFKPNNKITIKEFMNLINRSKMVVDRYEDSEIYRKRDDKSLMIDTRDIDFFEASNAILDLSKGDYISIFGEKTALNKPITRLEAVKVLSKTILNGNMHSTDGLNIYSDTSDESVIHLLSLRVLNGGDKFRPDDFLTRGETASLLSKSINYLVD